MVLALQNRSDDTARFLSKSMHSGVQYLKLDGSLSDEEEEVFANCILPTVRYVRGLLDLSINDYVLKVATGLR